MSTVERQRVSARRETLLGELRFQACCAQLGAERNGYGLCLTFCWHAASKRDLLRRLHKL